MFYDLENPLSFTKEIYNCLDQDGLWHFEQSYMPDIIKNVSYDTICHEHLYYYSTKVIIDIVLKHNLRVFDLKRNNINGGSTQYFICKKNSKYKTNYKPINKILNEERKFKLENKKTFLNFYKEINTIKSKTKNTLFY